MLTLLWIIVAIVVITVVVAFLNRFYRKATRGIALVRTGFGGKQVIIDGGTLALPFLNSISEVNMQSIEMTVSCTGEKSLITEDRLRVDTAVQFYVRVEPTPDGVATASQTLGRRTFKSEDLQDMLEGKLLGVVQAVVAKHTLDQLHENRAEFSREVHALLGEDLARNGLILDTVSLTRMDQTPFAALDENNSFNASGMRRLAEVIATNKKKRVAIETDAEVAVRQSQLEATKRKLLLEQEEEEAALAQKLAIERVRAEQQAEITERQAESQKRSDAARIMAGQQTRAAEINRDKSLQEQEVLARHEVEMAKHDTAIALANKASEVTLAEAETRKAEAQRATAEEGIAAARELAEAERKQRVAIIRAKTDSEVDTERTSSAVDTIRREAMAKAEALVADADAQKKASLAEAEGLAAKIAAENTQQPEVIRMKLDMHRLDRMPKIVAEMVRPAEKIDSIKIHQISGLNTGIGGQGSGGKGSGEGGNPPLVNQVIDGVLGMALQMPALKKLGEEIGVDLEDGINTITAKETPKSGTKNPPKAD